VRTKLAILALSFVSASLLYGEPVKSEGSIIQVSRKLRMSANEPNPPKDFYLDIGFRQGIRPGDTVEVSRVMAVLNGVTGDASSLLRVPLGEIKILLVGEFTSVGRAISLTDPNQIPTLEFPWMMIGDQVEPKGRVPSEESAALSPSPVPVPEAAAPPVMTEEVDAAPTNPENTETKSSLPFQPEAP